MSKPKDPEKPSTGISNGAVVVRLLFKPWRKRCDVTGPLAILRSVRVNVLPLLSSAGGGGELIVKERTKSSLIDRGSSSRICEYPWSSSDEKSSMMYCPAFHVRVDVEEGLLRLKEKRDIVGVRGVWQRRVAV